MGAPGVPASLRSWMSAVGEITRAVNAAEPVDALLARVAEHACALIGFEYCAVMLADGGRLRVAGSSGLSLDYVSLVSDAGSIVIHPPGPQQDTPAARAHREGRTVAVPDVETAHYGRLRVLAPGQGYRALLAAPLCTAGERAGVVVGYSVAPREFGPTERELLELLAGQAALAIETARLRARQQAVIRELSAANAELRRGRAVLEWAERQHHELMQLVLADIGLAGIVASLSETLGASVTVEDADGRVLARAPEQGHRPPPGAAARRRRPVRAALDARHHSYQVVRVPAGRVGRPGAAAVGHPPERGPAAWMAPVVLGGELAGRLWVVEPRSTPDAVQRRAIERFALAVGLELLKRRHLADAEARLSGDLIGDLLRGTGPEHLPGVAERAAALGHDIGRPHVVAVLAVDPAEGGTRVRDLVRAGAEPDATVLVGRYDDAHVLLLPADPDPAPLLRRVLDAVTAAAQAACGRAVATLVLGPAATSPDEYAAAHRVAAGAMRLRRARRTGGFVDVRELGLPALLLETGTPEALCRFSERLLGPVAAHDARRGGELVTTLRTWLEVGCSGPRAADALVVHPNTVAYRLTRIEQLTGRSLRRPDTRMELQLALAVRDVADLGDGHRPPPGAG